MTEEKLQEIEARANAATPGPWEYIPDDIGGYMVSNCKECQSIVASADYDWLCSKEYLSVSYDDADFIAHAREDIPALIEEVRRLRDGQEDWRKHEDELPFREGWDYLVCFRNGKVVAARYCCEGIWSYEGAILSEREISHWMPLPKPPREVEG